MEKDDKYDLFIKSFLPKKRIVNAEESEYQGKPYKNIYYWMEIPLSLIYSIRLTKEIDKIARFPKGKIRLDDLHRLFKHMFYSQINASLEVNDDSVDGVISIVPDKSLRHIIISYYIYGRDDKEIRNFARRFAKVISYWGAFRVRKKLDKVDDGHVITFDLQLTRNRKHLPDNQLKEYIDSLFDMIKRSYGEFELNLDRVVIGIYGFPSKIRDRDYRLFLTSYARLVDAVIEKQKNAERIKEIIASIDPETYKITVLEPLLSKNMRKNIDAILKKEHGLKDNYVFRRYVLPLIRDIVYNLVKEVLIKSKYETKKDKNGTPILVYGGNNLPGRKDVVLHLIPMSKDMQKVVRELAEKGIERLAKAYSSYIKRYEKDYIGYGTVAYTVRPTGEDVFELMKITRAGLSVDKEEAGKIFSRKSRVPSAFYTGFGHKVFVTKPGYYRLNVILHEFAHALDNKEYAEKIFTSKEKPREPVKTIAKKYFSDPRIRLRANEILLDFGLVTDLNHHDKPYELFAELAELMMLMPREFKRRYPDMYKLMEKAIREADPEFLAFIKKMQKLNLSRLPSALEKVLYSKSPLKRNLPEYIKRILAKPTGKLTREEKDLLFRWALARLGRRFLFDVSRNAKQRARYVYTWVIDPSRRDIPGVDTRRRLKEARYRYQRMKKYIALGI